ncbi:MAG: GntR family transcriptional regulator [Clostridiales bacterium]|nr:GntR family transcriptional regulator [Clostridiales bacterium]
MAKIPKYRMIYEYYRDLIESGALKPEERLPTEGEIKRQFSVSQITTINALKQLAADGYVTRVQGSGTYVRAKAPIASGAMQLVLLVIPFMGKGRESRLIESVERCLGQAGYTLIIKNSCDSDAVERQIVEQYKDRVSGILLYPSIQLGNIELYRALADADYPIVYLDRYPLSVPCRYVSSDNAQGGALLARYLLRRKYERFVLAFHSVPGLTSERDRLNGFMNVLVDAGVGDEHTSCFFFDNAELAESVVRVSDEAQRLVASGARTAIFTCNDSTAYRVMDRLRQCGVTGADDRLIVAGFDNLNIAPVTMPFVTISQQHADIGRHAAQILIRRLERPHFYNEYRQVPVELYEPPIVRAPAPDDPAS